MFCPSINRHNKKIIYIFCPSFDRYNNKNIYNYILYIFYQLQQNSHRDLCTM